jgi:hypothetical protein
MGLQTGRKSGVRSTSEKTANTRHPFDTPPRTREVEGSQSYRARTMGELNRYAVRVPEPKVWSTKKRTNRLDGSGSVSRREH